MMNSLQNQDFVKSAKGGTGRVRPDFEFLVFFTRTSCFL